MGYSYNRTGNSNYNPSPYARNYRPRYNNYSAPSNNYQRPKKHSGCGSKSLPDGGVVIFGWRLAGRDMIKLYARPYKGTKVSTSKSGKRWANLFVTLTNQRTMQTIKTSGLYNLDSGKLYISELNLIANPKAPNGGYFGKHISKYYNR